MREVAVTEGDKVEAQLRFGYAVNGHALGDLAARIDAIDEDRVQALLQAYEADYELVPEVREGGERRARPGRRRPHRGRPARLPAARRLRRLHHHLREPARHPPAAGSGVQRLMADGYGFGAEGDWKTAALLRAIKIMGAGKPGGASFMEDYTYHLVPGEELVLGAHMLEVCPSIAGAQDRPRLDVQPLSIGKKDDPARLIFAAAPGRAIHSTLIDLGHRFRLICHEVDVVAPPQALPRLPVAHAVYRPLPDLARGTEAWIHAGGAHHTVFSQNVSVDQLRAWAEVFGIECVHIGADTDPAQLKQMLRWGEAAWR